MPSPTGLIRVGALAVTLSVAPFAAGSKDAGLIMVNDAFCETQNGTCCPEAGSWCNAGTVDHENYYYKASGKCSFGG